MESNNTDEAEVVKLALDYIKKTNLLPGIKLKVISKALPLVSSGLDFILAGRLISGHPGSMPYADQSIH